MNSVRQHKRLPLIVYVPGLLPKPQAHIHRQALRRCLVAGLRQIDSTLATTVEDNDDVFQIASWTHDFYGEYRDFSLDAAAVDAVIGQAAASKRDIAEASNWKRRIGKWLNELGDRLPVLIPHLASERVLTHLRDLRRYVLDIDDCGEAARAHLKILLQGAMATKRTVLLIGHSMGSLIAYDSLWQMSQAQGDVSQVDLLLTMGSPLGERYIQQRLLSHRLQGDPPYPRNIRRWINLAAVGDLTANDPTLADDFSSLVRAGAVKSIEDHRMFNYFRLDGELNPHAEYGYLRNRVTAQIVADWLMESVQKV